MTIQPWLLGQTSPSWKITLATSDPNVPDLTGVALNSMSLIVVDKATGNQTNGLGNFTQIVTLKNPAVVVYQPNGFDLFVLNAKSYRLYIQVNFSNGPDLFGPYQFTTSPL